MSRNVALAGLSEQERVFVRTLVAGKSASEAAALAGYAYPKESDWTLLNRPQVMAAVLHMSRLRLAGLVPQAINVYEMAAKGVKCNKVTFDAAGQILSRSGLIPPKAGDPDKPSDIPLNELTLDELRRRADRLEAAIAERARVVEALPGNSAPFAPRTSDEPIDIPE